MLCCVVPPVGVWIHPRLVLPLELEILSLLCVALLVGDVESVDLLCELLFSMNSVEPILIFGRTTIHQETPIFLLVPFPL